MNAKEKLERIKMNLCLEKEFYDLLLEQAQRDYMRVSTWTTQYLKKSLLGSNKKIKMVESNGKV
jgi:hypothetical protein